MSETDQPALQNPKLAQRVRYPSETLRQGGRHRPNFAFPLGTEYTKMRRNVFSMLAPFVSRHYRVRIGPWDIKCPFRRLAWWLQHARLESIRVEIACFSITSSAERLHAQE